MEPPAVVLSRPHPAVLQVQINRPGHRNAISIDVQHGLDRALDDANADPQIRAMVLTGAGSQAFCAGYDIHEMSALPEPERQQMLREREDLLWRFLTCPVPSVAALNGPAHGAGAMLAMCSDLRVGGPSSALQFAAVRYGGVALTWLLDTLVGGSWARDLLLTARTLDGEQARQAGLIPRFVEDHRVGEAALAAAVELATLPPQAVRTAKELLLETSGLRLRERYDAELATTEMLLHDSRPGQMFETFLQESARRRDRRTG